MTAPDTRPATANDEFDGLTIEVFEAGNIDAAAFPHAAHIFIGWSYLQQVDLQQAIQRYTQGLRRLTRKLGVPGKYHETITCFFLAVIAERCRAMPSAGWSTFKATNPDLFVDAKGLLSRYYTQRCLDSPLAREQFLLPDRGLSGKDCSTAQTPGPLARASCSRHGNDLMDAPRPIVDNIYLAVRRLGE